MNDSKPTCGWNESSAVPLPPLCKTCNGVGFVRELIAVTGEPELDRLSMRTCHSCNGNKLSISSVDVLRLLGFENVVKAG